MRATVTTHLDSLQIKRWNLVFLLFVMLKYADLYSTYWFVENTVGPAEANPLIRTIIDYAGYEPLILISMAVCIILTQTSKYAYDYDRRLGLLSVGFVIGLFTLTLVNNLFAIVSVFVF